jgi:nucleotide-binding universal stress UspA family protein
MVDERMWPIVAGVDGSRPSRAAWEYAAEEAAARVTPLILVHAITDEADSDDLVADAVEAAQARHPALSVTGYGVPGHPVGVLTAVASSAGLLVVGHRGRNPRAGHVAGSVALRLVGACPVPLLVHRPLDRTGEVPLPRPVLVGMDPASGTPGLVEFAFAEAALRGAPLHVIWLRLTSPAGEAATEVLRLWSEKYPDVDVTVTARPDVDAVVALAAASHSAQLVVVGTTDRPAAQWAARALVDRAGCPIAVVAL